MKTHHACLLLTTVSLLASCASLPAAEVPPANAPPANTMPAAYMAVGTEPFWNLEITPERLNFSGPDMPRIIVPHGGWLAAAGVRTIQTQRLNVRIVIEACSDGMSERQYTEAVTVVANGRTFTGCGGPETPHPPASLERSGWRATAINGAPALVGVNVDFNFADGRVNGTGGCNRLMGSFTQDRDRLIFGQIGMTRMACDGPRGAQEQRIAAILSQPLTVRFGERMTMTWTAPDGSSIALRRLDWD